MTKILLAVDGSPCSSAAIDALIARTRPADTDVCVLHVVEWPIGGPPYLSFGAGPDAIQGVLALREKALERGESLVREGVARLRTAGFSASGTVRQGDARSIIVEVAKTWPADLIVMGSHGRRGLDRIALGSVAESVLHRATCSVAIVRSNRRVAADGDQAISVGATPSGPSLVSPP